MQSQVLEQSTLEESSLIDPLPDLLATPHTPRNYVKTKVRGVASETNRLWGKESRISSVCSKVKVFS